MLLDHTKSPVSSGIAIVIPNAVLWKGQSCTGNLAATIKLLYSASSHNYGQVIPLHWSVYSSKQLLRAGE